MENLVPIIVQAISGLAGGNAAGAALKDYSLGTVGNSIAGLVGGAAGGQILAAILGSGVGQNLVGQILSGAGSGAVLTAIAGIVMKMMNKPA